jgi:hypothetical protein
VEPLAGLLVWLPQAIKASHATIEMRTRQIMAGWARSGNVALRGLRRRGTGLCDLPQEDILVAFSVRISELRRKAAPARRTEWRRRVLFRANPDSAIRVAVPCCVH